MLVTFFSQYFQKPSLSESLLSPMAQSMAYRAREQEAFGSIPGSTNILSEDDSHRERIDSFLSHCVHCFDNCYVGKQSVAYKEYCAQCWLKELCTGKHEWEHFTS